MHPIDPDQPKLYIIAGCNGAGKTTASYNILPEILSCREFVNADEIAKGLSPFHPEDMTIQAGKLMIKRVNELIAMKKTFAIETTLATRSYKKLIIRAKSIGYSVCLLYFWLPSPQMAEERVAARVLAGGHNIPKDVIYRRYYPGIKNLFDIFAPIVDYWSLYDNSDILKPIVVDNTIYDYKKLSEIKELCQIPTYPTE